MPKMSSKVVIGTILVLAAVYYMPVIIQHIEQPHRKYHSYDPDIFVGNWIPDIFPQDVTDIHEQHDIDTNEVWVRLDAKEMPFIKAKSNTELVSENQIEKSALSVPMNAKWWFSSLEPNSSI